MYRHDSTEDADLSQTGALLAVDSLDGTTTVSVAVSASAASDFAVDVDFGDGQWFTWQTYGTVQSVTDSLSIAARRVRVRNTTAQTDGDTADVTVGAA